VLTAGVGFDAGIASKKLPPGVMLGAACLVVVEDLAPKELVRSAKGDGLAAGWAAEPKLREPKASSRLPNPDDCD